MESLQQAYESELKESGSKIKGLIEKALKLFDSEELLKQSIDHAKQTILVKIGKTMPTKSRFLQKNQI